MWLDTGDTEAHDRLLDERVDTMLKAGLVEEARCLLPEVSSVGEERGLKQAIGCKEVWSHVTDGVPLKECVENLKCATRQYARRQRKWYRYARECMKLE